MRLNAREWRNQLHETGHYQREGDVALLASLDIAATRYPILWEAVAPDAPERRDYAWCDRRMRALNEAGIEAIVTLLHHGSGPQYTSLIDDDFPNLFADFARATAVRYPHVRRWTPINEPLTTARFSTLYGVWYPNATNDEAFGKAIVNETLAILFAMRAIRETIPDAKLVLTEDLQGFTAADRHVADYVAHKSERRYLSAELIMGRVTPGTAMWTYLVRRCGVPQERLFTLQAMAMPIDLMGWNYYPNSERFLSTDGLHHSSNVALVDVAPERLDARALLRAAWQRLRIPFALSEVHVIGNESERARWMLQRYRDVEALRAEGVDVRAFGAWAAFGMVDWTSLLLNRDGFCEDGVFTCEPASGIPQPTRVSEVLRCLANGVVPEVPPAPGWWEHTTAVA